MTDLMLGAVAYDPKVVTIWEGFRELLRQSDFDLDFVLYSHYERQVEDLLVGRIDVAWNSPLAWVRAHRMAESLGVDVSAIAMRDTDRDLRSAIVVRSGSSAHSLADLRGKTVGVGAIDSPQATLLPLSTLRSNGLVPGQDVHIKYFNVGVGLHGDHIGGERDVAVAVRDGEIDAGCLIDSNLLRFAQEGTLPSSNVRVVGQTELFDHCNMTAGPSGSAANLERFTELLLAMSYADPLVRPLLDLEGLTKWLPGRVDRYEPLELAVDESRFYDREGAICVSDYRP